MFDKLEFIIALARERHFGRAAETCGVSQPTLSAGIKQLEDGFGVLLVNRGSRFGGFTPEGERVLDWARRIVGDARAMHQEIDALKRGLAGEIRIAAIPTTLAMTAMLTTPYRAKHPEVRFSIFSRNSVEVLRLLDNLEVDAGPDLPRQRAAREGQHHSALSGGVPAADVAGRRTRQARPRHLGGGRQDPALPADAGHAEPSHHRRPAPRRRSRAFADAGIELDDRALRPCADRQVVEHHAGEARRDAGADRKRALDPDRRAGGDPCGRPRRAASRADDAAGDCARRRGQKPGGGARPVASGGPGRAGPQRPNPRPAALAGDRRRGADQRSGFRIGRYAVAY